MVAPNGAKEDKAAEITATGWICYLARGESVILPLHDIFFILNSRLTGSSLKTQQQLLRDAATVISTASSS